MGIDMRMVVKIEGKKNHLSPRDIKRLSYRVCDAFGYDWFCIEREGNAYGGARHALSIVEEYKQDGDSIFPNADEQLIEVNSFNRYYGVGYERGPVHNFIALAEWLELNIPAGAVYYGGDSRGVLAEPFNKKARDTLFKHFAKVGHLPYVSAFGDEKGSQMCTFCEEYMTQYGFGQSYSAYTCRGCGYHKSSNDKGITWKEWVGDNEPEETQ